MRIRICKFLLLVIPLLNLTSCIEDEDTGEIKKWRKENRAYYDGLAESVDENGQLEYTRYVPDWATGITILIKQHTPIQPDGIKPMDNSLVDVVYEGKLYDGTVFDNSYSQTAYGDSIYRTRPMSNVPGFWAALTTMSPGDSITAVLPSEAGYGGNYSGSIKPYSTLVFEIKLKRIVAWDSPAK